MLYPLLHRVTPSRKALGMARGQIRDIVRFALFGNQILQKKVFSIIGNTHAPFKLYLCLAMELYALCRSQQVIFINFQNRNELTDRFLIIWYLKAKPLVLENVS